MAGDVLSQYYLTINLPALRAVARVRAGARARAPARRARIVYHTVGVRCRIHDS